MTPEKAMELMKPVANISSVVTTELDRLGMKHSCIYGSILLTKVMHKMGYSKARAMTVRALIFNPELTAWMKENEVESWAEAEAEWSSVGGRGISLGEGRRELVPESQWLGHLAVVIPNHFDDRHLLLDLTIPQVNKPEWRIILPSMLLRIPDTFIKGENEFKAGANGSMVIYMGFPEDHSYQETDLWINQSQYDHVVESIISKL